METSQQADRLLIALAEQLKTPLVQIAQLSELAAVDSSASISIITKQALRAVDAFLLAEAQTVLELEPVSVGAVLYDVAHELSPLAREYGVELEIDARGRTVPIMAHQGNLQTLVSLLGSTLIQSVGDTSSEPQRVVLGCHTTKGGIVVGAFGSANETAGASLGVARKLYGRASQTSADTTATASVMLADKLAVQLQSVLKVYRHSSLQGMGALFAHSKQLRLLS